MDVNYKKIRPKLYLVFRLVFLCISSLIMVLGAAAAGLYHKKDDVGAMKEVMIVIPVSLIPNTKRYKHMLTISQPALAIIVAGVDLIFPAIPRPIILAFDTITWPFFLIVGTLLTSGFLGGWSRPPPSVSSASVHIDNSVTVINLIIAFFYYLSFSLNLGLKVWLCAIIHKMRKEARRTLWCKSIGSESRDEEDIAKELQNEVFWSLEHERVDGIAGQGNDRRRMSLD